MKISIIGPGIMQIPPKGWGAVESLIWDYAIELENIGHEVQIVNFPDSNRIIREVNEFNPDFVHLQYDDLYYIMDSINCDNKAVTTHYGYLEQPDKYGYGYQNIFRGFKYGKFNIICLSEGIKNTYIKYGLNPEKLHVCGNGARSDLFKFKEFPTKINKSIYLAKIEPRKRQFYYCDISSVDFVGNKEDVRFDFSKDNYLGAWDKNFLYNNLTEYSNLVLLSDGEADPLVTKEALMAGLGLVISEYATANLDLSLPFITVIPENRILDINFVETKIVENRKISNMMRKEIREYALKNFSWDVIINNYMNVVKNICQI